MTELQVLMDGQRCGMVTQTRTGDLRFVYDDAYREQPDPTPLSLSMPIQVAEHRKRAILPFLEGLLTDNPVARQALATRYGVSPRSAFGLLSKIGADVAGALQFIPPDEDSGPVPSITEHGEVMELAEADVHDLLQAVIDEFRDGRAVTDALGRFSLAGAQPKIALARTTSGSWIQSLGAQPLESTPTTHILKPVATSYRRLDVVEHLTMRAAAHLGLEVAQSELMVFGSLPTFVVTRYDRVVRDGVWRRLHQEDLCQALRVMPEKKYQRDDGGPGVPHVATLLKALPRPEDRGMAAEHFFAGLMFNVVIQGSDAHAKNYSLILSGRSVALAPLYDLATYAPYATTEGGVASSMKIGGEYDYGAIGEKECLSAATTLGVDRDRAVEILRHLRTGAASAFEAARDELVHTDADTRSFADDVVRAVVRLPLVNPNS